MEGQWVRVTNWEYAGYMEGQRQLSQWFCPGHPRHGMQAEHDADKPLTEPPPTRDQWPIDPNPPGTKWNL